MRQIKFRAWDEYEGLMCYKVNSFNLNNGELIQSYYKFMQFTGLHDKNGKEIYEGDIIKTYYDDLCIVEYNYGCFCINTSAFYESFSLFDWSGDNAEIIGNIYENPELIGK